MVFQGGKHGGNDGGGNRRVEQCDAGRDKGNGGGMNGQQRGVKNQAPPEGREGCRYDGDDSVAASPELEWKRIAERSVA